MIYFSLSGRLINVLFPCQYCANHAEISVSDTNCSLQLVLDIFYDYFFSISIISK